MKVLVTGASGFVGQHVVLQLLKRGHVVTAVGRHEAKARGFDWFDRVRFIECDIHCPITDPFEKFGRPEVVIHLAWPGLPNYKSLFHFEKNLPADYRFLKALVEGGANHLLIAGTCLEYGMQNGALTEMMPTMPSNPYALAKDTLRKLLQSYNYNIALHCNGLDCFICMGSVRTQIVCWHNLIMPLIMANPPLICQEENN